MQQAILTITANVCSRKLIIFVPKHSVVVGLVVSKRRLAKPLCPFLFVTVGRIAGFVHGVGVGVDGGGAVIAGGTVLVGVGLVTGMVTGVSIGRHVECGRKVERGYQRGFCQAKQV